MGTTLALLNGVLLLLIAAAGYLAITLARARADVETSWRKLWLTQQAEIVELRNRLSSHSWEGFHNLQTHTPASFDRAASVLHSLEQENGQVDPDTRDEFEERLRQSLRDSGIDLEADAEEPWVPVVG